MEKKYFRHYKDGEIVYRMIDESFNVLYRKGGKYYFGDNIKYKPCSLVLYSKEIVALNPDVDKSYGYKYTYQIVPDPTKRFYKVSRYEVCINDDALLGEFITTIKDN
jgi:hypothetical protein